MKDLIKKLLRENINADLSGTKIVDSEGNPMVVYRAQSDDRVQGAERQSAHRGIYFSADRESTKIYGDKIKAYYLNIKNPLILKDDDWNLSVIPDYYYKHLISKGFDGGVWLRHGVMYEIVAFYPEQVIPVDDGQLDENSKASSDPATLAALEREGKKLFPQMRIVPANQNEPHRPQVAVEVPEQDRVVTLGGFEKELAAAKVVKIEDWLKQKNIQYKKSNTTNSLYVNGKNELIRISDHRKGSFEGPDFLVRWSTSLLEILNAIYDLVKIK